MARITWRGVINFHRVTESQRVVSCPTRSILAARRRAQRSRDVCHAACRSPVPLRFLRLFQRFAAFYSPFSLSLSIDRIIPARFERKREGGIPTFPGFPGGNRTANRGGQPRFLTARGRKATSMATRRFMAVKPRRDSS